MGGGNQYIYIYNVKYFSLQQHHVPGGRSVFPCVRVHYLKEYLFFKELSLQPAGCSAWRGLNAPPQRSKTSRMSKRGAVASTKNKNINSINRQQKEKMGTRLLSSHSRCPTV